MMNDVHTAAVSGHNKTAYEQIDENPLTRHQKSLIGLTIVGNISEFFDMFLIGFVVSLLTDAWKLTGLEAGVILACSGLGTVVGSIMWGGLSDRFGRKHAFQWCVICFVVFTALSIFLPNRAWILLALLRVGVGIGVGGLNITSIPYVQEFVPTKQRGMLAGLASVFIPLGLLLGSVSQSIVGDNWRVLIALGVLPVFLLIWLNRVPESPRFYQTKGKDDEARKALAWALEIPKEQVGVLPEVTTTKKADYGELFSHHLRPLVIISLGSFCFILGSFAIQSWGQTLMKDAFGYSTQMVAYLFMGVAVADCIGRFGSAWLADVIGRRWTMFIFGIIGALGCFYAAFFHDSGWQFYIAILIIMTFADGVFGILNAFGGEQFPNDVRSTGLGLGYGLGAIAKIIGPAFMGVLVGGSFVAQHIDISVITTAFTFFGICLVIGAVTYLFAQETKGKKLESL
ncbi:MFS transporter [Bifidobacterium psychraerophilum]|nr:MFS transporter [Bifidobacterium psychraerophilum]